MTDKTIVYYPGCFATYYEPEVGHALVQVMERNGINVIISEQMLWHADAGQWQLQGR